MPIHPVGDPRALAFRPDEILKAFESGEAAQQARALRPHELEIAAAQSLEAANPGLRDLNIQQALHGGARITPAEFQGQTGGGLSQIRARTQQAAELERLRGDYDREAPYYDKLNTRYGDSLETFDRVQQATNNHIRPDGSTDVTIVDQTLKNEFQKLINLGISQTQPSDRTVRTLGEDGGSIPELINRVKRGLSPSGIMDPRDRAAMIELISDFHLQNANEYVQGIQARQEHFGGLGVGMAPRENRFLEHAQGAIQSGGIVMPTADPATRAPRTINPLEDARIQELNLTPSEVAQIQEVLGERALTPDQIIQAVRQGRSEAGAAPAATSVPAPNATGGEDLSQAKIEPVTPQPRWWTAPRIIPAAMTVVDRIAGAVAGAVGEAVTGRPGFYGPGSTSVAALIPTPNHDTASNEVVKQRLLDNRLIDSPDASEEDLRGLMDRLKAEVRESHRKPWSPDHKIRISNIRKLRARLRGEF